MADESSLRSINPKVTPWPTDFLVDNSSAKLACLYVDFEHSYYGYTADDCRSKRAFICEKNFDGSTVPYSDPPEIYDKTEIVAELFISLALSVTVLVILTLLIIISVAYVLFKKIRSKKKIKLEPETNAREASVRRITVGRVSESPCTSLCRRFTVIRYGQSVRRPKCSPAKVSPANVFRVELTRTAIRSGALTVIRYGQGGNRLASLSE
uniref:C-type lectin domain-containing protein n=1 Tax=Trichuris muris TaxID=70415 RepID=A0A5S6QE16_TRIMR